MNDWKKPVLQKYLFVYSEKDGSFPERLLVVPDGEKPRVPDSDQLTDTVEETQEDQRRAMLSRDYPTPQFHVATAWGNSWKAVQNNYAGLDYEYDSPSEKGALSKAGEESTATEALGRLHLETSATGGTKALFLVASILSFAVAFAGWSVFSPAFGSPGGWILALVHDPLHASPSLIVPVALVAGLVGLLRFVHYTRARVLVFESGIVVQPENRTVRWENVERLWFARRSLRSYGAPLPTRQSLRLEIRDGRPLDLPHRYYQMEDLVAIVRSHVEPLLLDRAHDRLDREGELSLGKNLCLTHEHLRFEDLGVAYPLSRVDRVVVRGGALQIFNTDGRVIHSGSVEMIPDAFVLSPLLAALRQSRDDD